MYSCRRRTYGLRKWKKTLVIDDDFILHLRWLQGKPLLMFCKLPESWRLLQCCQWCLVLSHMLVQSGCVCFSMFTIFRLLDLKSGLVLGSGFYQHWGGCQRPWRPAHFECRGRKAGTCTGRSGGEGHWQWAWVWCDVIEWRVGWLSQFGWWKRIKNI